MRIYAQAPAHRTRQLVGDALVAGWVLLWVWLGVRLHDLVDKLAGAGRRVEDAGDGVARSMRDVSDRVGDVPIGGDALRKPFESAGRAGSDLADAGREQQDIVHTVSFWLAVAVAGIAILVVLARWLPGRLAWIREATAASRLSYDVDLFAMRALTRLSLPELRRIDPEPAAAYLRRDPTVTERLAAAELDALGLRLPGSSRVSARA